MNLRFPSPGRARSLPPRLALCLLLLSLSGLAAARESDRWATSDFLPGRVIVQFTPAAAAAFAAATPALSGMLHSGIASLDELTSALSVTAARRLVRDAAVTSLRTIPDLQTCYVLKLPAGASVLAAIDRLAADPQVVRVEPDLLRRVSRVPNDVLWEAQWDKRLVGAPAAWSYSTGSRSVICAGIDTGTDWNHPDLTPSLWLNPGEDIDGDGVAWTDSSYPGDVFNDLNGIDDDGNGYIDDFLGWDFLTGIDDCTPAEDCDDQQDNDMAGRNAHGSHVDGIMAAAGNNRIGVAGMMWSGSLMALRAGYDATDGNGYIPTSASIPAILYAAANGARIINMSYGAASTSSFEQDAIVSAWNQGCLLFAASGNDGSSVLQYPAATDSVIAVNATDSDDQLAIWSNRGPWTDLCAPGSSPGVFSTVINGYAALTGTSMASPTAAGVAALLWSIFPELTNSQLRDLLLDNAADITAKNPSIPAVHLGRGRVDAARALATRAPQLLVTAVSVNDSAGGDGDGRLEAGESAALRLTVTNSVGWSTGYNVSATVAATDSNLSVTGDPWTVGLIGAGQSVASGGSALVVTARADLDSIYVATLRITFTAPGGYRQEEEFLLRVGRGPVLLVDDDGGQDYERYYGAALTELMGSLDAWNVVADSAPAAAELAQYRTVLWICGNDSLETLTAADQANLGAWLDNGGNLVLAGQNIDEDLRDAPFYSAYLHAQSEAAEGDSLLHGVGGDPVSSGLTLLLRGEDCGRNGLQSPSRILPTGDAISCFTYSRGGTGAVRYAGVYKLVYFAFALEAACGRVETNHFRDVIAAALNWTGTLPADDPRPAPRPSALALHPSYPNPFNPATTLAFDLPAALTVRLRVYDLLGREVAALVDGLLGAGAHTARFDGTGLASGVYVARLEAGPSTRSLKMVLLK